MCGLIQLSAWSQYSLRLPPFIQPPPQHSLTLFPANYRTMHECHYRGEYLKEVKARLADGTRLHPRSPGAGSSVRDDEDFALEDGLGKRRAFAV